MMKILKSEDFINEKANTKEIIVATDDTIEHIIFKEVDENGFRADLRHIDVSQVTNMSKLFFRALSNDYWKFNGNVSNWDVSNVKDMSYMFSWWYPCKRFNCDISGWDVSNVENMEGMFDGCKSFNQDISKWNVSNVKNMKKMFNGCKSFNQPLNNWNVSNVENMNSMFGGCTKFNQPLNDWNVSNVEYMNNMFDGCIEFNQPLNKWNVSKVTDIRYMFNGCTKFNQSLNGWNVSNVENALGMFYNCPNMNSDLSKLNFTKINDLKTSDLFNNDKCKKLYNVQNNKILLRTNDELIAEENIRFIQTTQLMFDLLAALKFGNKDDEYIKLELDNFNKCRATGMEDEYGKFGYKKVENIISQNLPDTYWYKCGINGGYYEYNIYDNANINVFTINFSYYKPDSYRKWTYGETKSHLLPFCYFEGETWEKYASQKYVQDEDRYESDVVLRGGYFRTISRSLKKDVVIIPNIKEFKTVEEYKALIAKVQTKHENEIQNQEAWNELLSNIVKNAPKSELDKLVKVYFQK